MALPCWPACHTKIILVLVQVGTIQPISDISAALAQLHRPDLIFHTDAAQSIGKVAMDVNALGVQSATIVGHKFGAPKGVAALYIKQGVDIDNFFHGGGQERGQRAGTENVLLIVGLGAAAEVALREGAESRVHMRRMRDRLQERLLSALPKAAVRINGPQNPDLGLPNTLSISIAGLNSYQLLTQLSERLAASAGAACHQQHGSSVSSVLAAMGVPLDYAVGTLRLSVGRHTTGEEVDQAVAMILEEAAVQGIHQV